MSGRTRDRTTEPEDAHRGWVAPTPADAREAGADRAMAEAERAVAVGSATAEQRLRVGRMAVARTQEQRREAWLADD